MNSNFKDANSKKYCFRFFKNWILKRHTTARILFFNLKTRKLVWGSLCQFLVPTCYFKILNTFIVQGVHKKLRNYEETSFIDTFGRFHPHLEPLCLVYLFVTFLWCRGLYFNPFQCTFLCIVCTGLFGLLKGKSAVA